MSIRDEIINKYGKDVIDKISPYTDQQHVQTFKNTSRASLNAVRMAIFSLEPRLGMYINQDEFYVNSMNEDNPIIIDRIKIAKTVKQITVGPSSLMNEIYKKREKMSKMQEKIVGLEVKPFLIGKLYKKLELTDFKKENNDFVQHPDGNDDIVDISTLDFVFDEKITIKLNHQRIESVNSCKGTIEVPIYLKVYDEDYDSCNFVANVVHCVIREEDSSSSSSTSTLSLDLMTNGCIPPKDVIKNTLNVSIPRILKSIKFVKEADAGGVSKFRILGSQTSVDILHCLIKEELYGNSIIFSTKNADTENYISGCTTVADTSRLIESALHKVKLLASQLI